jgi:4-amino-4-deoxy-L-arabinose transferase-like glycosyltransferase
MASKAHRKPSRRKGAPPLSARGRGAVQHAPRIDYHAVALGVVLLLVALIRFRLLAVPFERDEGEYAYIGSLILHGGVPYRDAYNMKLPGTYGMYSLIIAIFGSSPAGIHAGFMIVSLATIVLLYAAFRRLFDPMIGLVAATVYGLLSVSGPFLGFAAHATHFINLFAVLGLFFYSRSNDRRTWLDAGYTGLMFGLAFLMKQQAVFLVAFAGAMVIVRALLVRPARWKTTMASALAYGVGAVIPYAAVLVVMSAAGAFDKFWFWTVTYAGKYATSETPWEMTKALFGFSFGPMFSEYPLVWLLALAGLAVLWIGKYDLSQKLCVTLLAIFSFAAVWPGFNFRQHYFVLLLPAVGALAAVSLKYLTDLIPATRTHRVARAAPFVVIVSMGIIAMTNGRAYYLDDPVDLVSEKAYPGNPFVEALEIGKYIARNTTEEDRIAILGSEPEILVYSGRRSATGYVYVYPLVELHANNVKMQHEMMSEIEAARPKYLVYCNLAVSWLATSESPKDILQWFNRYAPAHYDVVGMVEMSSDGAPSEYYWDAAARRRPPRENSVYVLRRKGA